MNFLLLRYFRPIPMNPGVCIPPPMDPASVEKVMPSGVMPGCSLLTTMTPCRSGEMPTMHSKHPHDVIGSSIIVYALNRSSFPWVFSVTTSFTPDHWPLTSSRVDFFDIGLFGPVGAIWKDAFASSQLIAPHSPSLSGVTMHRCPGETLWHSVHV